jgi:hypothetical protein
MTFKGYIMSKTLSERRKLINEAMNKFEALDKDKMYFIGVYSALLMDLAMDTPRGTEKVLNVLGSLTRNAK